MKIIIVGGGSAGWMTAATLQSQLPQHQITLIESKNISSIGVGESTLGRIKDWTRLLKIEDKDFMKDTDASYKLSIKFTNFYKKRSEFHYPFGLPEIENNSAFLNDWWFKKLSNPKTSNSDYAECIFPTQMAYVNQNKFDTSREHAFHFDAVKFGIWLRDNRCKKVKHIIDDIVSVEQDKNGIKSLNNKYKADLYIDCTGFKSLLLGKSLKEPFESYADMLPNDSAWATRIKYKNKKKELVPYTNCTAIQNGWVWNIPLWSRIGTGYVYSSKFVDDETALKEFKKHLGQEALEFKKIKMRVGIHNRLWVKNVVAIGLSAGFIEPLESNGLFSVHDFLWHLLRSLQREKVTQWEKDNFTYRCKKTFKQFSEFVAMHYALSVRDDTPYWRHCFNKQWCDKLITLQQDHLVGFQSIAHNKMHDFHFDQRGGMHCIAAGMNWSPTDIPTLVYNNYRSIENMKKDWIPLIKELNYKKQNAIEKTKYKLNLLDYLKKYIYI